MDRFQSHSLAPSADALEQMAGLLGLSPSETGMLLRDLGVAWPPVEGAGSSTLNADGSALQLRRRSTRRGHATHLIADPAAGEPQILRAWQAIGVVQARVRRLNLDEVASERFQRAFTGAVPPVSALRGELGHGCLWVATSVVPNEAGPRFSMPAGPGDLAEARAAIRPQPAARGLFDQNDTASEAAYLNATWGNPADRWPRIREWLLDQGIAEQEIGFDPAWCAHAEAAALGIEVSATAPLRLGVYARLRRASSLWKISTESRDERVATFFEECVGESRLGDHGLWFARFYDVDRGLRDGVQWTVKALDRERSAASWNQTLARIHERCDLPNDELLEQLLSGSRESAWSMAAIGLGIDRHHGDATDYRDSGAPRIQTYLKPRAAPIPMKLPQR